MNKILSRTGVYTIHEVMKHILLCICLLISLLVGIFVQTWLVSCTPSNRMLIGASDKAEVEARFEAITDDEALRRTIDSLEQADQYASVVIGSRILANRYYSKGEFSNVTVERQRGLGMAVMTEDTVEVILACNTIGAAFRRLSRLDHASFFYHRALFYNRNYSQRKNPELLEPQAAFLNGLGNIYLQIGGYAKADSMFRLSFDICKEMDNWVDMGKNSANISTAKRKIGQYDSAAYYLDRALEFNLKGHSRLGKGLCRLQQGELEKDRHHYQACVALFKEAYDIMQSIDDRWYVMDCCISLASTEILLDSLPQAKEWLDKAHAIGRRLNSTERLAQISLLYYKLYDKMGDYTSAREAFHKSQSYTDSLQQNTRASMLRNLDAEYNRLQTETKLGLMQQHYTRREQRFMLYMVIVGLLALAYYVQNNKRRQQVYIHQRNIARENFFHAQEAQQDAERASQVKTVFLQNVTHEIRTPLNAIQGFSDVLISAREMGLSEEDCAELNHQIHFNTTNLTNILKDILLVSELESESMELTLQPTSVPDICQVAMESVRSQVPEGVQFTLDIDEESRECYVETNLQLLSLALKNLLSNACKYTRKGSITLDCRYDKGLQQLAFRVTDTGQGIRPEDAERCFERFEKLGSCIQGAGLGLSICRMIADCLQGEVYLDTSYQTGCRFVFCLHRVSTANPQLL